MDVFLAGAEYTSQAVEALIEKPDTLHLIHRCPEWARGLPGGFSQACALAREVGQVAFTNRSSDKNRAAGLGRMAGVSAAPGGIQAAGHN